jgi:hypothetical protein
LAGLEAGDGVGDAEHAGLRAAAELRQQHALAGLGLFQHLGQQQQRVRHAGVAHAVGQVVDHRLGTHAAGLGDLAVHPGEGAGEDEVVDLAGGHAGGFASASATAGGTSLAMPSSRTQRSSQW